MKPRIRLKNCFASKDVCTAIKLCPIKAVSYIETTEAILDKTLKCNCNDRKELGLTPMSVNGYSGGCDCVGGCESEDGNPLYDCGGTPYGRIIIDYDKCVRCGICAKECCGSAIDMVDESEPVSSEQLLALTMRETVGADDCWTHDLLSKGKQIIDGQVDCGCADGKC